MMHRRTFVSAAALVAGSALSIGRAAALSFEAPSAAVQKLRAERCTAAAEHASLLSEVETAMEGRQLDPAQRAEILAAVTCPLCGCRPVDLPMER